MRQPGKNGRKDGRTGDPQPATRQECPHLFERARDAFLSSVFGDSFTVGDFFETCFLNKARGHATFFFRLKRHERLAQQRKNRLSTVRLGRNFEVFYRSSFAGEASRFGFGGATRDELRGADQPTKDRDVLVQSGKFLVKNDEDRLSDIFCEMRIVYAPQRRAIHQSRILADDFLERGVSTGLDLRVGHAR